jgi:threonyl-tRNA synthetase
MPETVNLDSLALADPAEDYVSHRIALFDRLKAEQSACSPSTPITVTLPDGKVLPDTMSFASTPLDLAKGISQSLAQRSIIAKVPLRS